VSKVFAMARAYKCERAPLIVVARRLKRSHRSNSRCFLFDSLRTALRFFSEGTRSEQVCGGEP